MPTELSPVLCATDLGAAGRRAANLAAALAFVSGRPLRLLHVGDDPTTVFPASFPAAIAPAIEVLEARLSLRLAQERERVSAEQRRLSERVPCEAEFLQGRPWQTIVHRAAELHAWIIVIGSGPSAGGTGIPWLGSTADRVVRHARSPVLVVPNVAGTEPDPEAPPGLDRARWLVAIDFSAQSAAALALARELAHATHGSLVMAHVAQLPEPLLPFGDAGSHAVRDHVIASAESRLDELVEDREHHLEHVLATTGDPATELVRLAEEAGATGIAIGTRGLTGIAHVLLGSVAERVLHRARIPVLCVPG